jgi:hypothetical protein
LAVVSQQSNNTITRSVAEVSILTEIVFLFIIAILHNRLPQVTGTLGLSFVTALQPRNWSRRRMRLDLNQRT